MVEETITLYLGLKEGQRADFEVVGLSAAAFAEAVKEIAFILEPGLEVRLEFDSGTEGSLKLKAIIKSLKTPKSRQAALVSIIATIGLTLINDVRGYWRRNIVRSVSSTGAAQGIERRGHSPGRTSGDRHQREEDRQGPGPSDVQAA